MTGTQAKVTWTIVDPAPISGGFALTYTSEDLTISAGVAPAAGTISGNFAWNSAYPCSGITNVCNGSVATGCPTPK